MGNSHVYVDEYIQPNKVDPDHNIPPRRQRRPDLEKIFGVTSVMGGNGGTQSPASPAFLSDVRLHRECRTRKIEDGIHVMERVEGIGGGCKNLRGEDEGY